MILRPSRGRRGKPQSGIASYKGAGERWVGRFVDDSKEAMYGARGTLVGGCLLLCGLVGLASAATLTRQSSSSWGSSAGGADLDRGSVSTRHVTRDDPASAGGADLDRGSVTTRHVTRDDPSEAAADSTLGLRSGFGSSRPRAQPAGAEEADTPAVAADVPSLPPFALRVGAIPSLPRISLQAVRGPLFKAPNLHALVPQMMQGVLDGFARGTASTLSRTTIDDRPRH